MSINKVMIIGRLGQDPELKYTPSGAAVCNFSIATSESWNDKGGQKQEKTEWHRVVVWGKLGELCNQYLAKGRQAYLEGSLQTRSWDAKDGTKRYTTEIVARNVQFLGGNSQTTSTGAQNNFDQSAPNMNMGAAPATNPMNQDFNANADANFTADDIPF